MKKTFVIGDPVSHSLSPKLHNYWLKKHHIEGEYSARKVSLKALPSFVSEIKNSEFVGGNVTIPLKEKILTLCDDVSVEASEVGAVNTIYVENGKIGGMNTDWIGFNENLDQKTPGWDKNAEKSSAIIIGAGGASRAIAYALIRRKFSYIHILNRTKKRALELSKSLSLYAHEHTKLRAHALGEFESLASDCCLLINASSVGMGGSRFESLVLEKLPESAIVNDIVYIPINTPLLIDAKKLGLKTVDGLGMLLFQAAAGFKKWYGKQPEIDSELRNFMLSQLKEN